MVADRDGRDARTLDRDVAGPGLNRDPTQLVEWLDARLAAEPAVAAALGAAAHPPGTRILARAIAATAAASERVRAGAIRCERRPPAARNRADGPARSARCIGRVCAGFSCSRWIPNSRRYKSYVYENTELRFRRVPGEYLLSKSCQYPTQGEMDGCVIRHGATSRPLCASRAKGGSDGRLIGRRE